MGEGDAFLWGSAPDLVELPRERRWKAWRYRVLWTAGVAVVAMVASLAVAEIASQNVTLRTRQAKTDESAQDRLEAEKDPLSVNVRYADLKDAVEGVYIVLDTPLAPAEVDELRDLFAGRGSTPERFPQILRQHGGRLVVPVDLKSSVSGYAQPFFLDLSSERASPVHVTEMRAEEKSCTKSRARAVLHYPAQAVSPVEGVAFGLQRLTGSRALIPLTDEPRKGRGEPYFDHNVLTVGGSQSPVTMEVNGTVRNGWRCEWKIRATYNSGDEKNRTVTIDDEGKNLVTEGLPADPVQNWVLDPWLPVPGLVDCRTHPEDSPIC